MIETLESRQLLSASLVLDINKEPLSGGTAPSEPDSMINLNGKLLFTANDGKTGRMLWTSDGTAAGTKFVADIGVGISSGKRPIVMTVYNGKAYFFGSDAAHGHELWSSDGTTAGTKMLVDINPGPADASGSEPPAQLIVSGNYLYFSAHEETHGWEVWRTNGTAAGTIRLSNITPSNNSYGPGTLAAFKGSVYFSQPNASLSPEIWKTDGTIVGTVKVSDGSLAAPVVAGSKLYFLSDINGLSLVVTDGTLGGTTKLKGFTSDVGNMTAVGDKLYFSTYEAARSIDTLWISDGTAAGTHPVMDGSAGIKGVLPASLTPVGNTLYFVGSSNPGKVAIFKTDGTNAGTKQVFETTYSSDRLNESIVLVNAGGTLYVKDDSRLYRTDGTGDGTAQVALLVTNSSSIFSSKYRIFCTIGNTLYFIANDGVTGSELWKLTPAVANASISGNVFKDLNSDGVKNGDPNLAGWTVFLDDNGNNMLDVGEAHHLTNASGNYSFTVPAGNYKVRIALQPGYRVSTTNTAGYDVSLADNQQLANQNFGVTTNVLLAGKVFNDANGNGIREPAEALLANITVNIVSNGSIITSRKTDAQGQWKVQGLSAGSGQVVVVPPPGYIATLPSNGKYSGQLNSGQWDLGLNFGLHKIAPAPALPVSSSDAILSNNFTGLRFFADE